MIYLDKFWCHTWLSNAPPCVIPLPGLAFVTPLSLWLYYLFASLNITPLPPPPLPHPFISSLSFVFLSLLVWQPLCAQSFVASDEVSSCSQKCTYLWHPWVNWIKDVTCEAHLAPRALSFSSWCCLWVFDWTCTPYSECPGSSPSPAGASLGHMLHLEHGACHCIWFGTQISPMPLFWPAGSDEFDTSELACKIHLSPAFHGQLSSVWYMPKYLPISN